jgi:hypothetical protein
MRSVVDRNVVMRRMTVFAVQIRNNNNQYSVWQSEQAPGNTKIWLNMAHLTTAELNRESLGILLHKHVIRPLPGVAGN